MQHRVMWPLCVLAIVLPSACGTVSQELQQIEPISLTTGVITGTVVDSVSLQPIVGAELVLLTEGGQAVSDQQPKAFSFAPRGEYRFGDVRPGSYIVRAHADGYEVSTKTVTRIAAGDRYTLAFSLARRK